MEDFEEIITLLDEDGKAIDFELVMSIEANDNNYAILAPLEATEEEEDEAYIFKIQEDQDGEMILEAIDNDEEYQMVVEVYETLVEEE